MISYIFKNKTKNILAIVFTILYILSQNYIYQIYTYISRQEFPLRTVVGMLPYILILVYMFTLKREYKFKNWLCPLAFVVLTAFSVYSMIGTLILNIEYFKALGLISILIFVPNIAVIVAYVLGFFGTIKNFKNVIFLRVAMIINMITLVIAQVVDLFLAGGFAYFESIPQEQLGNVYLLMFKAIIKLLIMLLFYFGILNLTLNKKGEYIDITPYVQERKAKKEAKREAKLKAQQEQEDLDMPAPEVPEGCWRCMACGKILNDNTDRCECGYKK